MAGANPAQPFDAHQLDVLQLLAAQLAASVESAHLHEELHDLIGRLLVAQEEERRRVAYDVHDSLAQVAASTHQHLQALARHYRPRTAVARAELAQALELALRTVRETRRVIADLRPTVLDDFGLATALRLEVDGLRASGWDIDFDDGLGEQRLGPATETALFRIAQEALTNVRKHAQTTRAHVALRRTDQVLRLEVRDWGRGFRAGEPHPASAPGERIGLRGMQERMALLGGRCMVRSSPGAGTQVVAEIGM
jgi:signal transduction histidine kinase